MSLLMPLHFSLHYFNMSFASFYLRYSDLPFHRQYAFSFLQCFVGLFCFVLFFNNHVLWNSRIASCVFWKYTATLSSMVLRCFASPHTLCNCNILLLFTIYFKLVTVAILKYMFSSFYVSRMKSKIRFKSDPKFFILPLIRITVVWVFLYSSGTF